MQTTMMRSTPVQSPTCSRTSAFRASRAAPKARKQVVVKAQAEEKARGPAKAASALLAAVAAAQFALTGAAQAIDLPLLKDVPQIFSPEDAKDQAAGKGQAASSKFVEQAKGAAGGAAADQIANAPSINKQGGSMGRADFAPSMQAKGKDNPTDIRGGTPTGWMNALPDMSAAPIASKDAGAANDGKANLPKPGGVSKALTGVGKGLTDALPNAPDISNPKGSKGVPTISKLTKGSNPVKIRGAEPSEGNAANPGKIGESIANNINGPDPKGEASKVSKNLPDIAQKTDIAPESVGAEANARN